MTRSRRILVVDDDLERADLLARALSPLAEVRIAGNRPDAARLLAERGWALVVTDWSLYDDGSGCDVAADAELIDPDLPVIAYSQLYGGGVRSVVERHPNVAALLDARQPRFHGLLRQTAARLLEGKPGDVRPGGPLILGDDVSRALCSRLLEPCSRRWRTSTEPPSEFIRELIQTACDDRPAFGVEPEPGCGLEIAAAILREARQQWEAARAAPMRSTQDHRRVVTVELPTLRERAGDWDLLVADVIGRLAGARGEAPKRVSQDAMAALRDRHWSRNLESLESTLRGACGRAAARPVIVRDDLPGGEAAVLPARLRSLRRERQQTCLRYLGIAGTIRGAAKLAKQAPSTFRRASLELGILRLDRD